MALFCCGMKKKRNFADDNYWGRRSLWLSYSSHLIYI